MNLIFLGLVAATLLLHMAAAGTLAARWLPVPALARSAVLLTLLLVAFCVEHAVGLGRLGWVWPLSTVASAVWLLSRMRTQGGFPWRAELPFALPFLGALAWRCCFPDIDGHSEQLSDFAMIATYTAGDRLPSTDFWQPELPMNMYYGLQFYAAALLGRTMDLSAGYAMNVAHAVLFGWSAELVWSVATACGVPRALRVLPVAAAMLGGSGIAPLTHFIVEHHPVTRGDRASAAEDSLWTSVRFAGMYDAHINTPFGRALFHVNPPDTGADLPVENFAYLTFQGDFHPPLGGFMLLFLALACIAWIDRGLMAVSGAGPPAPVPPVRLAHALLGATVPLALAVNTWVFPLQAVLVGGWAALAWLNRRPVDAWALAAGAGLAALLLYPFLGPFSASGLDVAFGMVAGAQHTPVDRFVGLLWPAVALCAIALVRGGPGWGRSLALLLLVFLLVSEFVFIDDHGSGRYQRFNTALKWWSWIYAAAVVGGGACALARRGPGRWVAALVLLAVASYAVDLAAYLAYRDKPSFARLEGHRWLTRDPPQLRMLEWLREAPPGIVLEGSDNAGGETYSSTSAFALHAGKPSATGWAHHEGQWRGDPWYIAHDAEVATRLYRGEVDPSLRWFDAHRIRYIVWARRDQDRDGAARARLEAALAPFYYWMPFYVNGEEQLGIWVRK